MRSKYLKVLAVVLCVVFVFSLAGCGGSGDKAAKSPGTADAGKKVKIKLAHVLQPGAESLWQRDAEFFKKVVEEKSKGQIEVQIFPSGQLGSERQIIEQLQSGALEAGITTSGPLGNFNPLFNLYCLPYLFESLDEAQALLNGPVGEEYKKLMSDLRIVHIGWIEDGFRNVFTKKPVTHVNDLKGLKLRTMEAPVWIETYKAFGAGAVPMAYTELYSALQQGVVDGADALTTNYISDRMYEVAPSYNLLEFAKNPTSLLISKKFFDGLTAEQQQILIEAGKETQQFGYDEYRKYMDSEFKAVCEKYGAKVVEIKDKSSFIEATRPVWQIIAKNIPGADGWLERVQAAKKAYSESHKK